MKLNINEFTQMSLTQGKNECRPKKSEDFLGPEKHSFSRKNVRFVLL